jgi:two-component system cell cycle sensor histidine kinase PleC
VKRKVRDVGLMNTKLDIIAPSDIGPTRPVMLLALLATLFLGLFIIYEREKLSDSRYDQQLRREVILDVFVIRENIQAQIFDRILALRELATIISQDPDVSDEVFGAAAQRYLTNNPEVINVAMAPDLIITSIFPIEGNEKAIGLNYRENEEQFPKVQQAMETGDGLVTGPVNLVQGGQGLILRQPIFVKRNPEDEASQEPWGMLSMVVDYQAFLDGLGLPEFTKKYDILIHEIGAESHEQQTFFGDPAILDRDPEKLEFDFPFGVWELAATTAGGWPKFRPDFQRTLAIEYLVLVLVLGVLWYVLQLVEAHRTNKRLLTNAIEALPDAFVIFDPKGRMVTCNSRYVELLGGDPELIVPGVHYRQLILAAIDRRNMLEAIGREQEWLADWEQKRKKGSFDHEITTLTGRVIRASDRTMPDGNTVGLRVDVTELKEAKVAADAANKAKSGSAPGRGVIPTVARAEWSLA